MTVLLMCPMWKGFAILGEENSTITVLLPPMSEFPYLSLRPMTSAITSDTSFSLEMNMFT